MLSLPLRVLHAAMAVLLIYAAALQTNDEAPWPWIAMYLAAGFPCALVTMGKARGRLAAGVAVLASLWAVVYLLNGAWAVPPSAMFAEWTMSNDRVREARELYGLLLIAAFMAFSAWASFRVRAAR